MAQVRAAIGALALASMLATPAVAQDAATAHAAAAQLSSTAPAAAPVAPVAAATTAPVRTRHHHAKGDPLEGFNRAMFKVFKVLDRFLYRPVAVAYKTVIPKPLRTGIRHVFSNIGEPIVFLNDVLQVRPKRAVKTFGRFLVNSTVGIGGVLDVAKTKDFDLPHHDNGFGNTLGRYGIGPGPYLFLPFVGPSTFRDFVGGGADSVVLPYAIGEPFDRAEYQVANSVLTGLDTRVESDQDMRTLESGAIDPYATLRSAYLQDRAATIAELRHGGRASDALDDPLTDPAAGGSAARPALPADDPLTDPAAPAMVPPQPVPATAAAAAPVIDPVTTAPPVVTLPHAA